MSKGILKHLPPPPPEWKEADEIVPHVWLGTLTDNEHARRRNISNVICISKDPPADLQRQGFRSALDLDVKVFTLESDTEGNLLSIFTDVCDLIDKILGHAQGEGVLVWDVGGGVAAVAGYIMRTHEVCLPEAMMTITRARLKRPKPTPFPSQNIIDMLHNETYQTQLDIWQISNYERDEAHDPQLTLKRPPKGPGERTHHRSSEVEELEAETQRLCAIQTRIRERFSHISKQPHRLSTIEEVEEEARRLSMIREE